MNTVLFFARILLGGFLIYRGVARVVKTGLSFQGGNLIVYNLPSIVAGLMGVTLLLCGFCLVCGISPFMGIVWTGWRTARHTGPPVADYPEHITVGAQ